MHGLWGLATVNKKLQMGKAWSHKNLNAAPTMMTISSHDTAWLARCAVLPEMLYHHVLAALVLKWSHHLLPKQAPACMSAHFGCLSASSYSLTCRSLHIRLAMSLFLSRLHTHNYIEQNNIFKEMDDEQTIFHCAQFTRFSSSTLKSIDQIQFVQLLGVLFWCVV